MVNPITTRLIPKGLLKRLPPSLSAGPLNPTTPTLASLGQAQPLQSLSRRIYDEIPARHAQSVAILSSLTKIMPSAASITSSESIHSTIERFVQDISILSQIQKPSSTMEQDKNQEFPNTLKALQSRHNGTIDHAQEGLRRLSTVQLSKDRFRMMLLLLEDFYNLNIGSSLLMAEYINLIENKAPLARLIQPHKIAEKAIADAQVICRQHFNQPAPTVELVMKDRNLTTAYVESHLHRILFEVIKNSMGAVSERHRDNKEIPPLKLVIAKGGEDIAFRLSDRGTGLAQSCLKDLFNFGLSTKAVNSSDTTDSAPISNQRNPLRETELKNDLPTYISQPLYRPGGHGLSLSRLYARYFGGEVEVVSMEGFGTESYVYLKREGANK
ncbi:histidine kinase-like ATPase [Paraphysoderma sedebokerense]|nr:histidine kinase-like ATPase [Paraphysoderma sedebokerense]